jgi:type II secretory pathway pseudopilin PulG
MVILMGIVLVAVNPGRQYQLSRDAKRQSDVNAILNAINQFQVDNDGNPPQEAVMATCPSTSTLGTGVGNLDLSDDLVASYIAEMPVDPDSSCDASGTCYEVCQTGAGRITVSAPNVETRSSINVTR